LYSEGGEDKGGIVQSLGGKQDRLEVEIHFRHGGRKKVSIGEGRVPGGWGNRSSIVKTTSKKGTVRDHPMWGESPCEDRFGAVPNTQLKRKPLRANIPPAMGRGRSIGAPEYRGRIRKRRDPCGGKA